MKRLLLIFCGFIFCASSLIAQVTETADDLKLPQMQPKKWALCIGVSNYQSLGKLAYSAKDSITFAQTLKSDLGFSEESVFVMADKEGYQTPNAENVKNKLDEILSKSSLDSGDLFIIYFSGHGMGLSDGDYWMPNDASVADAQQKGIAVSDIIARLSKKQLRNVVIISDACRAGQQNTFGRELIEQSRKTNIGVLLGCAPGGKSYEVPQFAQGAFTYFLTKALKGKSAVDPTSGALLLSKLGANVAKTVEEYTRHDYGTNAQKPTIFAEKEQEVVLATTLPKVTETTDFLKAYKEALTIGQFTESQYKDALTVLASMLYQNKRSEESLSILRVLQSFGKLQSPALYTYVLICDEQGASYELNSVLQKNNIDDPDSLFDDLAMIHGGVQSVGQARFIKAIWNIYESESSELFIPALDALLQQANADPSEKMRFVDRMQKDHQSNKLILAYANLLKISLSSDKNNLESAYQAVEALDTRKEYVDACLRVLYRTFLRARQFEKAAKIIETARTQFPESSYWEMRSLIVAALLRDPNLNARAKEVLAKSGSGSSILSIIRILRDGALLMEPEFKAAADRLPKSLDAQVAYWVVKNCRNLKDFETVPESLEKLAKSHLLACKLAYGQINTLFTIGLDSGWLSAGDAANVRLVMANDLCANFKEIGDDPEIVLLLANLLNRTDQSYRLSMLGLMGSWEGIEDQLVTSKEDFLKEFYISLINNGLNEAAKPILAKLEKMGAMDKELLIRATIDGIFDKDFPRATALLERLQALNPTGAQGTTAKAVAAYLAFEKGDKTAITKFKGELKDEAVIDAGTKLYIEVISYLASGEYVPSATFTKMLIEPQPLFHDVWSVAVVNVLQRCQMRNEKDAQQIAEFLPYWIVAESLNGNLMHVGYNSKADVSVYAGHYEFLGYFAVQDQPYKGSFILDVDAKGMVKGVISIDGEKETIPVAGPLNEFGRGFLDASIGGKKNIGAFALIPYKHYLDSKPNDLPPINLLFNTTSPYRMAFVVRSKKDK